MNEPSENPDVLAVDLDGTLLRSDMLHESLWSAFGRDWRMPLTAALALRNGKPELKRVLSEQAQIDVSTLPFDEDVIALLQERRQNGQKIVLVTATHQQLANQVAAHLGLFDEVHGSNGQTNLKGKAKAEFLIERYGVGGYEYFGDSAADLPVWAAAKQGIAVNASQKVRSQTAKLDVTVTQITTSNGLPYDYARALRPHQWLKNILVFLPMLAGHQLTWATFFASLMAFFAFSFVASSVYVLNDLLDLRADRSHPRKRHRPFAAGDLPIAHGGYMAIGLLLAGIALSIWIGGLFLLVMLTYYFATLAYSVGLKRRAIVDICVLAGLYTLRIVAGGAATGIPLSVWLLAFSIFFFFAMAAIKRQAELVDMAARGKLEASGRGYSVDDLQIISMMAVGAGYVSVMVMMLYVNSPSVVELYKNPTMLWGICCVLLYWISRIVIVTHRGHMHDDPVVFAAKDRISQFCLVIMMVFALAGAVI